MTPRAAFEVTGNKPTNNGNNNSHNDNSNNNYNCDNDHNNNAAGTFALTVSFVSTGDIAPLLTDNRFPIIFRVPQNVS